MLLAELEVRHSRAVAPTRRVALGLHWLPTDPPPGFGGVLLGGIVAAHLDAIDDDMLVALLRLIDDLEAGRRIAQPRLRHRFQTDVVGLDRSRHKLVGRGEQVTFEIDDHGAPVPQVLGAVYAASRIHSSTRAVVFDTVRRAMRWDGRIGPELVSWLTDPTYAGPASWRRFPTDARWALQVLGFGPDSEPEPEEVRRRFRFLIREVHPDHGAEIDGAGQRVVELTQARRILLT
jgi:hypothetical protein